MEMKESVMKNIKFSNIVVGYSRARTLQKISSAWYSKANFSPIHIRYGDMEY